MIIGIVLAAGKGTRLKSTSQNKVTLPFFNKPLIVYSVELMQKVCDKTVVVVGAFRESVKKILKDYSVFFAHQEDQLGTGHATVVGLDEIVKKNWQPSEVLVGYGDHSMFYKKEDIFQMINLHKNTQSAMTFVTTYYDCPEKLHWGRIIRDKNNNIIESIEEKDADEKQKKIKELNAGFYCFDFNFLKENINTVPRSSISGEYYINSLIKIIADKGKKVTSFKIPFSSVGIGINTQKELAESEKIYLQKT